MKNSTIKTVLLACVLLLPLMAIAESGSGKMRRHIGKFSNDNEFDTYVTVDYSFTGGKQKLTRDNGEEKALDPSFGYRNIEYNGTIKEGENVDASIRIASVSGKGDDIEGFVAHVYVVEMLGNYDERVLKEVPHHCVQWSNNSHRLTAAAVDCHQGGSPSAHLSYKVPEGVKRFKVILETKAYSKKDHAGDRHGYGPFTVTLYYDVEEGDKSALPPYAEEQTKTDDEDASEEVTSTYVEEDNDASSESGPWGYLIPLSVIAGLTGFVLTRKKGDKKDKNDKEKQPAVTFEMQVYKDFGNSLLTGDAPRQVLARIVAHTPQGSFTDPQMTAMIQFEPGDGYLQVRDGGMAGDWRAAWINAPELPNLPEDAVLTAKMVNGEAGFVNRLHFVVENGEVLFGQDNLTLPAFYKKEVRLPFVVVGIDPKKDPVVVTITQNGKPCEDYKVRVEWNEKDQMYYAIINDQVLDEKAHPGVPGKYITYKLNIKATRSSGSEVKGGLTIFRYYMGLQIKVKDIGCYIEEHQPLNHKLTGIGVQSKGKYYVPAETRVYLTLFDYDEEHNQLLKGYPKPSAFRMTANDPDKQYMVDKLGLQIVATQHIDPDNGRICLVRCCSHMLTAPNRLAAAFDIKVHCGERDYTSTVGVRLCSQPVRHIVDDHEWAAAQKEDQRISEQLDHIASEIYRNHLVENLFPLLKFINLLRESYDEDQSFGYDKASVKMVAKTYADVFSGRKAGANADPAPPITFADELGMFVMEWFNAARTVQQNTGFWGGLFIGIFAPWVSVAFTAVEVLGDMRDYVEAGGDSVLKGWCVGAKVVVREYVMGKVMETGFAKAQKMGFTPENMNQAFKEMSTIDVKQFWSKSKLSYLTKEINFHQSTTAQAKADVDALMKDVELKSKAGGKLDDATNFGSARAKQNVQDLRAACELCRTNPTPKNLELRDKLIMQCQGDKQTMYLLKQKGSAFDLTRKDFNGHLEDLYARTDAAVEAELSRRLGGAEVSHKNMSSKTRTDLKEGKTITLDRDSTYQYKDADGNWRTIENQELVDKIYKEKFYQESTGGFRSGTDDAPISLKEKIESHYGQKMDQTIIQNELSHPESYGTDVKKMLGKEHAAALDDATQVSKAVEFKGLERFERGRKMLLDAEKIADPLEKVAKQADAIGELMEGCRQEVKIFDQFTIPRDLARANINGGSQVSPRLKKAIEVARNFEPGTKLEDVEAALDRLGYTLESFAKDMGDTMFRIG